MGILDGAAATRMVTMIPRTVLIAWLVLGCLGPHVTTGMLRLVVVGRVSLSHPALCFFIGSITMLSQRPQTNVPDKRVYAKYWIYNYNPYKGPATRYFFTGPLTPAPMTLGSSSLPIEYNMPMPDDTKNARTTPLKTKSQNGTEMSRFWQAGPPQ